MNLLLAYIEHFFSTKFGQMLLSFGRVALATLVGAWVTAGAPIGVSADQLMGWLQLGVTAGAALVVANYFGPWESRYGSGKGVK